MGSALMGSLQNKVLENKGKSPYDYYWLSAFVRNQGALPAGPLGAACAIPRSAASADAIIIIIIIIIIIFSILIIIMIFIFVH